MFVFSLLYKFKHQKNYHTPALVFTMRESSTFKASFRLSCGQRNKISVTTLMKAYIHHYMEKND